MHEQTELFHASDEFDKSAYLVSNFSSDDFAPDTERLTIEGKYAPILSVVNNNNRQSVSFQLNKNNGVYGWFKYKEGFSPQLVQGFLDDMDLNSSSVVLDPFVGSGTTSLAGADFGVNTIGIDILPTSEVSVIAKSNIQSYDLKEIRRLSERIAVMKRPSDYRSRVNSVRITQYAYPDQTDYDIAYLKEWLKNTTEFSQESKQLATLAILNCLERLSFTSKDGQYLRWDSRSKKTQLANIRRKELGKKPIKSSLMKGVLPSAFPTIGEEIRIMSNDIAAVKQDRQSELNHTFLSGSMLRILPTLGNKSIDGVITSPPYLNRYDYSRTYALELAYLGLDEVEFKSLRQQLLSSTVENKSKMQWLREYYNDIGRLNDFDRTLEIIENDPVLKEINLALTMRAEHGDLNNSGVIRMVKGYFEETAFMISEMARIMKPGAKYVTVNDNVRYGGEVISVDFISTHLAETFGFTPLSVETIKQQKGNSSQQMKKFGRVALRKSITIWQR